MREKNRFFFFFLKDDHITISDFHLNISRIEEEKKNLNNNIKIRKQK